MGKLFGTDGVRGLANEELTGELALKLGRAGAFYLSGGQGGSFVVGRDTRISGDFLEASVAAGICPAGSKAIKVGVLPTPAIAFLTKALKADGGVVISASHNPAEYNGIKFFDAQGLKLSEQAEEEIENRLEAESTIAKCTSSRIGGVKDLGDALELYADHVADTLDGDLKGMKIVVDCANGAANQVSPLVLRKLGASVTVLSDNPDGLNINLNCGSTSIGLLREAVKQEGADIGFAHDGDADRVIAVDEAGSVVDGDYIMAICATRCKEQDILKNDSVVTTLMTNMGFDLAMRRHGIKVYKTKVGDRYVLEEMLARDIGLGGEQSGHIIFLDHNTTGDGLITALQLAEAMRQTGQRLSALKSVMSRLPQSLINVEVKDKSLIGKTPAIGQVVEAAEKELAETGRILVRPSGTEPVVRVMVEADSDGLAESVAKRVADIIHGELG